MKKMNRSLTNPKDYPIKILQFGEGNFLRGFADYMIDIANEKDIFQGNIVIVKPISRGNLTSFYEQEFQYTVSLRGLVQGKASTINRKISSITDAVDCYEEFEKYKELAKIPSLRFIISNTTEAGIVFDPEDSFFLTPAKTFPGKLTQFLYYRFQAFTGDLSKGCIMLPVELIDDNGLFLKKYVLDYIRLWKLGDEFLSWIENSCIFASTLVDRIITGYPGNEKKEWELLGYEDRLMVTGEPFGLWVIESDTDISEEFPLPKAGLPVVFTEDLTPYKQRKVRILNGAHTSFVLASYLCGNDIVRTSMEDKDIYEFMRSLLFEEVIPTLPSKVKDPEEFALDVIQRFKNPYVDHSLLAISLNSLSKWKARCLPSLTAYIDKFDRLPQKLTFSLAALLAFYHGNEIREGNLIGYRDQETYNICDEEEVLLFFRDHFDQDTSTLVRNFLSYPVFWEKDLNQIPELTDTLIHYYDEIQRNGMRNALCRIL